MRKIAYLGPAKTNTHLAARNRFGSGYEYIPALTVEDVFQLVERKKVDFGVVAVENSLEGAITHTLDRFVDFEESPIKIYGEIDESIHHFLIMRPRTPEEKVRLIFSHYSALDQCRGWLKANFPAASYRETSSTAKAIDILFDKKASIFSLDERAAIGRRELAEERKLKAIPIPIDQENRTRFLVIALHKNPRCGGKNKTSLMFALKDKPGALYDALRPFKRFGINLTKIESRPSKRKVWEYVFFIDFEGNELDAPVKQVLKALVRCTSDFRVLGSYPIEKV